MALQCIILLLISVFFSKALAVKCYGCIPDSMTGTCTDVETTCQSQCNSITTTAYIGDFKQNQSMKICSESFPCITGSINYGGSKVTLNTQCCSTDLCNSQNAPDLPRRAPNGKSCYTCENANCLKVLPCEGDETQCFTISVETDGKTTLKGCSSKLICGSAASQVLGRSASAEMKCCEGNLCNSAHSIRALFMPLVTLISLLYF